MSESSGEVKLYPVHSSHLDRIGYNAMTKTLHVFFKDGSHYTYHEVSQAAFSKLLQADSPGSHFHQHIRPYHRASKVPR